LTRAGMTPRDVLRSATSVPADVFGLSDRGRIAPGRRADLLLVAGDPLTDVTATRDVRAVWRSGVRLSAAP
jgi:imidazolonepropionase-like amidohydrolase